MFSDNHSTVDGSVRTNKKSTFRLDISKGVGSWSTLSSTDESSFIRFLDITNPSIVLHEGRYKLSSASSLDSQVSSESKHASWWHLEWKQLSSVSLFSCVKQNSFTIIEVIYDCRNVFQITIDSDLFKRIKGSVGLGALLSNDFRRGDAHLIAFSAHIFNEHSQVKITTSWDNDTIGLTLFGRYFERHIILSFSV